MEHADNHAACTPESCITAKLRYWRATSAPPMHLGFAGQPHNEWREKPSVHQQERNHIRELRAAGVEFDRA